MSQKLDQERINERAGRGRLAVRNRPYWRLIAEGFHIGYRKGARKGSWMARLRAEGDGDQGYQTEAIGQADDTHPANGDDILT